MRCSWRDSGLDRCYCHKSFSFLKAQFKFKYLPSAISECPSNSWIWLFNERNMILRLVEKSFGHKFVRVAVQFGVMWNCPERRSEMERLVWQGFVESYQALGITVEPMITWAHTPSQYELSPLPAGMRYPLYSSLCMTRWGRPDPDVVMKFDAKCR